MTGAILARPFASNLLHGDDLQEVVDAQPAAKAGGAGSGQNMIRPGGIVPGRLRRIVADENRARTVHPGEIVIVDREVFGSDAVDPGHGLLPRSLPPANVHCGESLAPRSHCSGWQLRSRLLRLFASAGLVVMNTTTASGSCSACATKSAARNLGLPASLYKTASVGPASISMAQSKLTSFFAAVTKLFPGPTILSTRGIVFGAVG